MISRLLYCCYKQLLALGTLHLLHYFYVRHTFDPLKFSSNRRSWNATCPWNSLSISWLKFVWLNTKICMAVLSYQWLLRPYGCFQNLCVEALGRPELRPLLASFRTDREEKKRVLNSCAFTKTFLPVLQLFYDTFCKFLLNRFSMSYEQPISSIYPC